MIPELDKAYKIYFAIFGEPTDHQQWAEAFNIRERIRRLLTESSVPLSCTVPSYDGDVQTEAIKKANRYSNKWSKKKIQPSMLTAFLHGYIQCLDDLRHENQL